jgi:hypothetical protein
MMTTLGRIVAAVELSRKTMILDALKFEHEYARIGRMTVQQLRDRGRIVIPCPQYPKCEEAECKGWNSVPGDLLDDYKMMGKVPRNWVWPQEVA